MNRTGTSRSCFLMCLVFLLAGCGAARATPAPTPPRQPTPNPAFTATPSFPLPEGPIDFQVSATQKFSGHVTGQGATALILAGMAYEDETQWDPFVQALDKGKFTIITFKYLRDDYADATQDTGIVLSLLRQVGYKRVICIGASLGVTACGSIVLQPEMAGVVMIAGPNYAQPVKTSYPKLFIAAADDPWSTTTENAYNASTEPRKLVLYPDSSAHGTGMFYSDIKDQFLQTLLDFVNKQT